MTRNGRILLKNRCTSFGDVRFQRYCGRTTCTEFPNSLVFSYRYEPFTLPAGWVSPVVRPEIPSSTDQRHALLLSTRPESRAVRFLTGGDYDPLYSPEGGAKVHFRSSPGGGFVRGFRESSNSGVKPQEETGRPYLQGQDSHARSRRWNGDGLLARDVVPRN